MMQQCKHNDETYDKYTCLWSGMKLIGIYPYLSEILMKGGAKFHIASGQLLEYIVGFSVNALRIM